MKQGSSKGYLLRQKRYRKAIPEGLPKLANVPRNWTSQGILYMDAGELSTRLLIEAVQNFCIWVLLCWLFSDSSPVLMVLWAFLIVHTWNWITNNLFWTVIIFTFPTLRNPGAVSTVDYLNLMRERLAKRKCISGILIYGSVARSRWHDRSDIDIRLLRRPGMFSLLCAALVTMRERFQAFLSKQPMDLFLADDVDFLKKMRSDEIPLLTLCRDDRLKSLYPDCREKKVHLTDLLGEDSME